MSFPQFRSLYYYYCPLFYDILIKVKGETTVKFICQSSVLRSEIELANSFSSSKNSLSISSNVLLEAGNDALSIKATDQKMGFSSAISVSVQIPGETTVYCEKLSQLLKNIPDTEIEVSEENGNLVIKPSDGSESFLINIKTIDASKFPELEEIDESLFFSLTQRDFFDMIDKTSFAVADEDSRHFLTGVYMEKKEGNVAMVATDGKRLAYVCRRFEQNIPDFMPAIIPVRFLSLMKSIGSGEGLLSIGIKEGCIFAEIGNRTIYSSLIQGPYPAYEKVIPKNLENSCIIKKEDAEKAISLISILVESKSKRIFIDLSEGRMVLSSENTDFGDSHQAIPVSYSGPDVRMSFNCQLLLAPIKKTDSEYMKIMFNKPSSAMIFTSEPEKDYLFVLMPMQI